MISFDTISVSMFANVKATQPSSVKLSTLLETIRNGTYAVEIATLRETLKRDRKAYNRDKTSLPAFTISGEASSRTEMIRHSNLIQVDLDKLGERLEEIRAKVRNDPHVALGFISPSGEGLKLGVVIHGANHEQCYVAVESYFREVYGVEIDKRCKDRLRLCLVSHDPYLWINQAAVPLQVIAEKTDKQGGEGGDSSASCILNGSIPDLLNPYDPKSLHACNTTSLHNNTTAIITNIEAEKRALAELEQNHPGLRAIYVKLVERRFPPKPHERNHFLVQAVPFLYRAVARSIIPPLVSCFFKCNHHLFHDSYAQHMKEAEAMIEGVAATYQTSLSADEGIIYSALEATQQDAFRICRDLAYLPEPVRPPRTFFMSFGELGARLGIHAQTAQRLMIAMQRFELVKLLEKGIKRQDGVRGIAGKYEWLLNKDISKS